MDDRITAGQQVSRRQVLRVASLGLSAPLLASLVSACGNPLKRDNDSSDDERHHSVGSDSSLQGTGSDMPTPAPVQPFELYDPVLQPVQPGPKDVTVTASDATLYVAEGVPYAGWTFDGSIPGQTLRVVEGDTVNVTFRVDPKASTAHSLDFHSARTSPEVNYRTIKQGEELKWSFVAKYPGAYLYHCGTPPVMMHLGAGMYGAMIVDPKDGWPPAQDLIFVQSEFYLADGPDDVKVPDMTKMMGNGSMDYVVFNGYANQYVEHPISVRVGEPIRIFLVNAGPNIWSSFHVVGAIFDAAYLNANPANKFVGQQSISVGPGDGACVEFVLDEPGIYTAVNHAFGHATHGAIALLNAE